MKDLKPLKDAVTEAKASYTSKQAKADSLSQSAIDAAKTAKSAEEKTTLKALQEEANAAQGDANIAKKALEDALTELAEATESNEQEKKQEDEKAAADKLVADKKAAQDKHIADTFKANPKINVVYATKDLKDVFIDKSFAVMHKRDMKVDFIEVKRPE